MKVGIYYEFITLDFFPFFVNSELYFVKGRLKFGESENSAPFPSAVVVFDGDSKQQVFGAMNR